MTLPHVLKRIRLNLARSKEFPEGSARRGLRVRGSARRRWHIHFGTLAGVP